MFVNLLTMSESNSEPPICPCGFFGRSETMGMCSKCYKDYLDKKTADADSHSPATPSAVHPSPAEIVSKSSSSSTLSSTQLDPPKTSLQQPAITDTIGKASPVLTTATPNGNSASTSSLSSLDKTIEQSTSPEASPSSATKRSREPSESDGTSDSDRPAQKSRKRCFKCNIKLQPAVVEIGRCRCDYTFCPLHRLPEQHDCIYDHKGRGRDEARGKMVLPKRHVGNELKRIDSDHKK